MSQIATSSNLGVRDFSYLDLPDFRQQYLSSDTALQMRFFVDGVKCSRCIEKIESLEGQLPGLTSLRVNLGTHQLEMQLQSEQFKFEPVVKAVEKLGFTLQPIQRKEDLQQLAKIGDRRDLIRLGVAAICASNIMMFSFALYAGATGALASLFQWLSFGLYLPVLTYVALPFYQGFYKALRDRQLSIDGPIVIASVGGFIFSAVNLVRGEGSLYFDSLAGFLFLIQISRFLQKRMQRSFLSFHGKLPIESLSRARKLSTLDDNERFVWTMSERLSPGDLILVKQGEVIPADGVLMSEGCRLDASFLTGESCALVRNQGMAIEAGVILLSGDAVLKVTAVAGQTQFGNLLIKIQESSGQKVKIQNLSDRWSQILLISVFSIAGLFLALAWSTSPAMALERSLALIILACPCAMAFGTPLALSFSLRRAFEKGFVIKSADVFDKLLEIKSVFFDKTGTLTGRGLKVVSIEPANVSAEVLAQVLALQVVSKHPIAEALRRYIPENILPTSGFSEVEERIGQGVSGRYAGSIYKMAGVMVASGAKAVALYKDEQVVVQFNLQDPLLDSAAVLLHSLASRGMQISILSGDSVEEVARVAKQLGLSVSRCLARLSPQDKANLVQGDQQTLMIGDGANDALAFQQADLGIAVSGSVEVALRSADVYLLSEDLGKIDELFEISRRAHNLIRRNLHISIVYNIVGGIGALLGFVNPFVAAILMPISSGFILLSSWLGSRK